jgi:CHAD domain-containing protein
MGHMPVNEMKLAGAGRLNSRLDQTFKSAWRSYRRAFKRCQGKLSRGTVHQLRLETRRLLALVDLFDPLMAEDAAGKVSRLFKPPFKASGRLRDVQVMLCDVERRLRRFPDAKRFKKELLRREKRLGRQLERELQRTRLKPLKNRMDALRKELRGTVKKADGRHRAWVCLFRGMDRAFANVMARRRGIAPMHPQAIHRTRIVFKKFRYMVEQLRLLVPGLAGGSSGRLRGHQKLMGDIQDCETLLAALDKFMRKEKAEGRRLRKFRAAVKRDHDRFMARYLRRADELFAFWKPAALSSAQPPLSGKS